MVAASAGELEKTQHTTTVALIHPQSEINGRVASRKILVKKTQINSLGPTLERGVFHALFDKL